MSITTVLFDLDGTLLPMDQDKFVQAYFGKLAQKLAPHGYDPKKLVAAIWKGTAAMVANDGKKTNEEVFWDKFCQIFGKKAREDEPIFQKFYEEVFIIAKTACGYNQRAAEAVALVKEKGLRVALATNPIFPAVATLSRIGWAGLKPDDFELYTTYENSCQSKPNLAYYKDILNQLGVDPDECVMVGNDVGEDMVASQLGMKVFLLTDDLINKAEEDISKYPNGGYDQLIDFIKSL